MAAWAGDFQERAERSRRQLRGALIEEVLRRAAGHTEPSLPTHDARALTRRKVMPMVSGLFPAAEREAILRLVEQSVIFVTSANLEQLLMDQRWDHTAWILGNLHLGSVGADLLSPEVSALVGLSEETTCFVSPLYFSDADQVSDFVVHEVAHIFHNCKRATVGLRETRRTEWLLDIAFRKRETFAYACEFFSWVMERSADAGSRRRMAAEIFWANSLTDERVDQREVAEIVLEAAQSRFGWRVILRRCTTGSPG